MLTQGDDVEAHALAERGWSISAIARHLERDRKTVRAYVTGERTAGVRRSAMPDPLTPFVPYLAARFVDDPHLWLTALFDEVIPLGYPRSYPSFVRAVRAADHVALAKVSHTPSSASRTSQAKLALLAGGTPYAQRLSSRRRSPRQSESLNGGLART